MKDTQLSQAVQSFIKTNDAVELAGALKQSFNEKLGSNPDFQEFAVKLEQYSTTSQDS